MPRKVVPVYGAACRSQHPNPSLITHPANVQQSEPSQGTDTTTRRANTKAFPGLLPGDMFRRLSLSGLINTQKQQEQRQSMPIAPPPSPQLEQFDQEQEQQQQELVQGDAAAVEAVVLEAEAEAAVPVMTPSELEALNHRLAHLAAEVHHLTERIAQLEGSGSGGSGIAPALPEPAAAGVVEAAVAIAPLPDALAEMDDDETDLSALYIEQQQQQQRAPYEAATPALEAEPAPVAAAAVSASFIPVDYSPVPSDIPRTGTTPYCLHNGALHRIFFDPDDTPVILTPRRTELTGPVAAAARVIQLPAAALEAIAACSGDRVPGVSVCVESTGAIPDVRGGHGSAPLEMTCLCDDGRTVARARKYVAFHGQLVPVYTAPLVGQFVSIAAPDLDEDGRVAPKVYWIERLMHIEFEAVYLRIEEEEVDASIERESAAKEVAAAAAAAADVMQGEEPSAEEARSTKVVESIVPKTAAAATVAISGDDSLVVDSFFSTGAGMLTQHVRLPAWIASAR